MQTCRVCFEAKDFTEFTFRKDSGKHRTDCKACVAKRTSANFSPEQRAAYLERRSVELAEYRKSYYSRPEVKERQSEYYSREEVAERRKQLGIEYRQREEVKVVNRVKQNRRRAILNGGDMPKNGWDMLKLFYGDKCMNENCPKTEARLELDHVVPISLGGKHSLNNAQILCQTCNLQKKIKSTDYRKGVILESLELNYHG